MRAMWLMLQQDTADDYVIASGVQYSVREFVSVAAPYFGLDIEWRGEGEAEVGYCMNLDRDIVKVHSRYFRPSEVDSLLGDATKARTVLGWKPEISFEDLVMDMCIHEI